MEGTDYKAMYEALLAQKAQKGPATKGNTFAARWGKQDGCGAMLFVEAIKLGYTAEQISPFPKDKIGFMVRCGCNTKNGNKTTRCKTHLKGNKWELDRPWKDVEMFPDEDKLRPYFIMNDTDGKVTEPKDMPQPARPQQRATAARSKGVTAKLKEALARIDELEALNADLENQVERLSVGQPDLDEGEASDDTIAFESDQEEQSPAPALSATSSASSVASQSSEGEYTREECLKNIKKYEKKGKLKKVKKWKKRLDKIGVELPDGTIVMTG